MTHHTKRIEVEAWQVGGDAGMPNWLIEIVAINGFHQLGPDGYVNIQDPDFQFHAGFGDWVVKDGNILHAVPPDIFAATYAAGGLSEEWQLIETALEVPEVRAGAKVMLWRGDGYGHEIGFYMPAPDDGSHSHPQDDFISGYRQHGGWAGEPERLDGCTHWAPLLVPPANKPTTATEG